MPVVVPDPLKAPVKVHSLTAVLKPGDRVLVPHPREDEIIEGKFLSRGRPMERDWVEDVRCVHGGYWRDIAWIALDGDDLPYAYPYKDIRPCGDACGAD